ncbi:ribonuclease P protein subunit p20 [Drosophila gunungcola]|nr:ribonuclease P protein subunit p20 [Drosophila gunungcola]
MMESNPPEHGTKPRSARHRPNHRVVRKQPARPASDLHNIYITSKTDFKAQQRRCEELLNAGAREIFLHCMGFSVTRGLNLALRLVHNSDGALSYAINTSTVQLVDELHPLCDAEDVIFRQRNNSALHIKIFNRSLFDIVVPQPSQSQSQAQFAQSRGKPKARQ